MKKIKLSFLIIEQYDYMTVAVQKESILPAFIDILTEGHLVRCSALWEDYSDINH